MMMRRQLAILYREFLFRVVDLELLAPQGDVAKLLGQFAAILVFLGILLAFSVLGFGDPRQPYADRLVAAWPIEHVIFSTTMLVVGIFAVLSWDSTYPDKRDLFVLGPLPVKVRTLFLAKIGAAATALGVTIVALNALTGLALPMALTPATTGLLDLMLTGELYRAFFAFWVTAAASGVFIYGAVLTVQGIAAQLLSRAAFLRLSSLLQMAGFVVLVTGYFLQPKLTSAANLGAVEWLPSYWFFAMFQQLNGSMHPSLEGLARLAWVGLSVVAVGACAAYVLCYFRTLRQIVEAPDIAGSGRRWRVPLLARSPIAEFAARTVLRSRQHRVLLAFYLGMGFATTVLFLKTPVAAHLLPESAITERWPPTVLPLLSSTVVMMAVWILGTRVALSIPLDLRANWVFRVLPLHQDPVRSRRRVYLMLAVAPAWLLSAVVLLATWPVRIAAAHLVLLAAIGLVLTEIALRAPSRFPFAAAYLPGRSRFHLTFWLCLTLVMRLIRKAAELELYALEDARLYAAAVAALGLIGAGLRYLNGSRQVDAWEFEPERDEEVAGLQLRRDGVLSLEA